MKSHFDLPIDRRNTRSVKWDEAAEGVLPMWVADMDFATAPVVQEAIRQRAQHPCFGYVLVPDEYYDAIIDWQRRRHQWQVSRESILYTIGVVPAVSACISAITQPGDKVIILTPVYNCFFSSIRNCGCQVESVALTHTWDEETQRTSWSVDLAALEAAAQDSKATTLLLCNPHNPTGHCWTRDELLSIARICAAHGVTVISDEIHCELTAPGTSYTPWGTLYASGSNEGSADVLPRYVACSSPSKAFNIAGLQNAYLICPDAELRRRIDRVINIHEICDVNPFGVEALIAAYSQEGEQWLDDLRQYLWDNYAEACRMLLSATPSSSTTSSQQPQPDSSQQPQPTSYSPRLRISDLQATYLLWLDISDFGDSTELSQRLMSQHGLWVTDGKVYGEEGAGYLRINLACPRDRMREGLSRLLTGLK